jgi:hypothetical protein
MLADVVTTWCILWRYKKGSIELNPLMRFIQKKITLEVMLYIKCFVTGFVLVWFAVDPHVTGIWAVVVYYGLIFIFNGVQLLGVRFKI